MQILVWILLPILLSAVAVTIFLHYKRKKRQDPLGDDAETDFVLAVPEQFSHHKNDGDYVYFDHSGLIREYKKRMFYNHARYTALRSDFSILQAKYSSLLTGEKISKTTKKIYMRNHEMQLAPVGTGILDDVNTEKKELSDKLEQLGRSYQRLEEENRFLQEQLSIPTASEEEKDQILHRWKNDNRILRDKVTEQEYLEELLEEKKNQIVFLQSQLEQRIRNQFQADQQRLQAITEMDEAVGAAEAMKSEILQHQEQADKLQMEICEKEEQLSGKQETLASKLDQITYLENVLHETKTQNDLLIAELGDTKDEVMRLRETLESERARANVTEQKLFANKQLLQKLGREISNSIAEDTGSPVVTLRTSTYMNKLNAEEMS